MNEEDIRHIVREEIAEYQRDRNAAMAAYLDQWQAEEAERLAVKPDDGPLVGEIKGILRGDKRA